ncbi:transglutaminase-like cysteine peptidase [Bradyrhizobium cenepequi]
MGMFSCSGALRALMLTCGLLWLAPAAHVSAGTLLSPGGALLIKKSIEPFGRATAILSEGGLRDKWLGLQRRLADDLVQLALCEGDREGCVSPAALKFLAVVDDAKARDGRARLGEVNRAVNLAIRPADDLVQYGAIDVWASPLTTFANGAGDCEDYAIAKFVALRLAGMAPEDLRIVIMHDALRGEDHAVTAARLDGQWLTLDNRRMMMVADTDVRNYRPTFVVDEAGVRRYADMPLLAEATLR